MLDAIGALRRGRGSVAPTRRLHDWGSRRGHRVGGLIALSVAATTVVGIAAQIAPSTAFAETNRYELYCPGTPIGNIAMNGVVTTGAMSPAKPKVGQSFTLTGYQTRIPILGTLVSAMAALGNTVLTGTATAAVDASGATPTSIVSPTMRYSVPIPKRIYRSGVTIAVPESPTTVGPFVATSKDTIRIGEDAHFTLTLVVSGNQLPLTCLAYPNNAVPTGLAHVTPPGSPISPVIANNR